MSFSILARVPNTLKKFSCFCWFCSNKFEFPDETEDKNKTKTIVAVVCTASNTQLRACPSLLESNYECDDLFSKYRFDGRFTNLKILKIHQTFTLLKMFTEKCYRFSMTNNLIVWPEFTIWHKNMFIFEFNIRGERESESPISSIQSPYCLCVCLVVPWQVLL